MLQQHHTTDFSWYANMRWIFSAWEEHTHCSSCIPPRTATRREESLSRCFAFGRGTSPLTAQSPLQSRPQSPEEGLRYSRRRDSNKICPFQGTEWHRRHEKQFNASSFYPPLKIVSPGVITPKTPHSRDQRPGHNPPLPFRL